MTLLVRVEITALEQLQCRSEEALYALILSRLVDGGCASARHVAEGEVTSYHSVALACLVVTWVGPDAAP